MRKFLLLLGSFSMFLGIWGCCAAGTGDKINLTFHDTRAESFFFYRDEDKKEIKHGTYVKMSNDNSGFSVSAVESYCHGVPVGVWVIQDLIRRTKIYFKDGSICQVIFYDYWGKEVAACSIKDGKPYNGSVWSWSLGLKSGLYSVLVHYCEGKKIAEEPFEGEKLDKLLQKLAEIQKMR